MIADTHLHTRLSPDAEQAHENSVSAFLDAARRLGLQYAAITEHCDILTDHEGYVNADLDAYAEAMEIARQALIAAAASPVRFLYGLELAHAHIKPLEAAEILRRNAYDFVLGSLHIPRSGADFYNLDYDAFSDGELAGLFEAYVGELYEIADGCDFDSLAHCTYPLRYFEKHGRLKVLCAEPEKAVPAYAEVFRRLIERGKALEVNTSGGAALSGRGLLALYRDLGGRFVTVGSDAHNFRLVGSGVGEAESLLGSLGFEGVTVFVGRQARVIPFA